MIKTSALPNENMPSDMSQTCRDQIDQKDAFNFLFFVEAMNSPLNPFANAWNLEQSNRQMYDPQQTAMHAIFHNTTKNYSFINNMDSCRSNVQTQKEFNSIKIEDAEYKMLTCNSFQELLNEDNNRILLSVKDDNSYNPDDQDRHFACKICGKTFKRRSSLSTHKLIHDNVKPYSCVVCRKNFLRRSDLKKHTLMHTGQKPHQCSECGRVFSQSSNMLTHMRRHSGVRPYSCQICGNSFYRKVDVRRHQAKHVREDESIPMNHH